MGNLKRVFDPAKGEVVIIDANKHKDRQTKFCHWTGKPFEVSEEVANRMPDIQLEKVVEKTLEDIQKEYEEKIGKLPPRYKNDIEWLSKKLYS